MLRVIVILVLISNFNSYSNVVNFKFYTHDISIASVSNSFSKFPSKIDDAKLKSITSGFEIDSKMQYVFVQLDSLAKNLDLSPWFMHKLIQTYLYQCFSSKDEIKITIYEWYFLNKLGYDVRLTLGRKYCLLAASENFYNCPFTNLNYKGRFFIVITNELEKDFTVSQVVINPKSFKIFSIINPKIPKLKNCKLEERKVSLVVNKKNIEIPFLINRTVVDVFKDYPKINYNFLIDVEFSNKCKNSLLPQVCKLLVSNDTTSSIKNILSFVQESSQYKEDIENYGFENPSTPEQALSEVFSDCEDRSVLFYYILKQLFKYQMVILEYPNHINVGVAIPNFKDGDRFTYDKKQFVICEPSDMSKNVILGYSSLFKKYPNPKVRILYNPTLLNFTNYTCK